MSRVPSDASSRAMSRGLCVGLLALLFTTLACHGTADFTRPRGWVVEEGGDREVQGRPGVVKQILLYLPNRIVDAFDIINISVGAGGGIPLDIRLTRWVQLAFSPGVGIGWTWDGRQQSSAFYTAGVTYAFGPWRSGVGTGRVSNVGSWEIGVGGGSGGKVAVDLAEILDFVLGWFFIDILKDDWGWQEVPPMRASNWSDSDWSSDW